MLKAALIGFYNMHRNNNPWEIIKKLSDWGYRAVENGGFLLHGDVNENLQKMADMNFTTLSLATDMNGLQNNLDDIMQKMQTIKVNKLCCYWSDAQSFDEAVSNAKIFDKAGEILSKNNFFLCYHNHDHEFKKSFNGVRYFDILMTETSPENVYLNLDVGWASFVIENVPELVRRFNKRIKIMHFKDFYDFNIHESFTALSTGKVKIQDILVAANDIGMDYITVEQDTVRNLNTDDTVLLSYLTLKESGLVE